MRHRLRVFWFVAWQHRRCWLRKDIGSVWLVCLQHGDRINVQRYTGKSAQPARATVISHGK